MNKVYNVIWSSALNALVVVAEGTKSRSKSTVRGLRVLIAFLLIAPASGMATTLPEGGMISIGEGTIVNAGNGQMTIKQTTDKLGINWQSFNVGADGHVIFDQPNYNSVALNRVIGSDGSSILGKIDSNGQVFIINPNGVVFGKDSQVNVGGIVASTMDITDQNFKDGNYHFDGQSKGGDVVNLGALNAAEGGYVALIGKNVKNQGVIKARLGSAALAAGGAVTLDFAGDGLLNIQVDKSAVDVLVENKGLIQTDGGNVLMTARATNALTETVVNNSGVVQAQTINGRGGKIFLDGGAERGTVMVSGMLDASAPITGNGGMIETSGSYVQIIDGAHITATAPGGVAGKWLLDPADFTITNGNSAQTSSSIGNATLSGILSSTNVELQTSASGGGVGNLYVNGGVSWSADTTLTLTAVNDVHINSNIDINGINGGLVINHGDTSIISGIQLNNGAKVNFNGSNSSFTENGKSFIMIRGAEDLSKISNLSALDSFAIANSFDASSTGGAINGQGFITSNHEIAWGGVLQGFGHSIRKLQIFQSASESDYSGVFGKTDGAIVKDISVDAIVHGGTSGILIADGANSYLKNVNVSGSIYGNTVGGILGIGDNVTLDNVTSVVYLESLINAGGGLAGVANNSSIYRSYAFVSMHGAGSLGGLVGSSINSNYDYVRAFGSIDSNPGSAVGGLLGSLTGGAVSNSYSTVRVTAPQADNVGGLVGTALNANISNAYSSGDVSGQNFVGGLVGKDTGGIYNSVFSTSKTTGASTVGGLIGQADTTGITNSYAGGSVQASGSTAGGFVGQGSDSTFQYTYSSGAVSGGSVLGGYMASNSGTTASESYWDIGASGQASSVVGVGKTTEQMHSASTFSNWNISNTGGTSDTWRIYEGYTGPLMRFAMTKADVTGTGELTYTSNTIGLSDLKPTGYGKSTVIYADGYWDNWNGDSKATTDANFILGGATHDNGLSIRNAGTYTTDKFYSSQYGYDIVQTANQVFVDKAALSIGVPVTAASKTYDGTKTATVTGSFTALGSDSVTAVLNSTYDTKDAGTNKAITINSVNLSGADGGNYKPVLSAPNSVGTIDKASLTVTAIGVNKAYDGTTSATVSLADNRIAGDSLTLGKTQANFADKNAGLNKTVSINGITVTGADAGNYEWNDSTTAVADIGRVVLGITATGVDKTYDGTKAATVELTDTRLGADDLTVTAGASTFTDKNADADKQISVSGINVTGADAANYIWDSTAVATADINKAVLDVTATAAGKTYDGSTSVSAVLSDNRIASDSLVISGSSKFADKNAGANKAVIVDGIEVTGADAQNYTWNETALTTATIEKAQLDITLGAASKDYDSTTHADVFLSDNRVSGDSLILGHTSATFEDKNAGAGKIVTVEGITVTGADAGNYNWAASGTTTADIGRAVLTINATGVSKTYDGTTDASSVFTDNRLGSDDLIVAADTISFVDKNADTGKQISISGITVNGADAGNYIWDATAIATADITKAHLDVSLAASGKTYDGDTAASATLLDNRVTGDNLVVTSSAASFADKNAGADKTVQVGSINVTGVDALNYEWNVSASTTATIDKAQLQVDATAFDKTYDGNTTAGTTLSDNRVLGDSLVVSSTNSNFSDKNAGLGKTVTVDGITVSGADASNYDWNTSAISQADIAKANLVITAAAQDKVYDGSAFASTTLSDNRVVSDDLVVSSSGSSFADKNAADGKTVTVSGIGVSGADAVNYTWSNTVTTNASIAKANLSVTASASDKVYDGSASASTVLADNRIGTDDLILSKGSSTFSDKNAASDKTVTVGGISVSGDDAQNYIWNTVATTTADIAKAQLDITIGAASKDYDATTNADVFISDNRVSGDSLAFTHDQAFFADKNAGSGKTVTVQDIGLTGADAGNYLWNTSATTTADIGRAVLSITASGVSKTYDGTTDASATFADSRLGSDDLSVSADTISFTDKNADTGKQISISGISVTGADAGNYIWDATAIATADIAKAALNVTATASNKIYDGGTGVSTTISDNRVGADALVITSNAAFSDKNAGVGKTVIVDAINVTGADSGNYTWNTETTTNADISKAQLVVTVGAASKDYDSTTDADAFLSDNHIAGDSLQLNYGHASFRDKNAGNAKSVAVEDITVTGLDAGNYEWNTRGDTTADIGRAVLTISATGVNKTYDGTTAATAIYSDNRLGSDSLTITADDATFIDKNAGTGKQVSISGVTVSGADAANYIWDATSVTTADITKANLVVTATASDKVYNGSALADAILGDNRIGSDSISLSSGPAAFSDKNAGDNKVVTISGITVSGVDAQNYTWNAVASTTADIAKAQLNITTGAVSRDYDATTNATAVLSDDRIAGDNLVLTHGQAQFDNKNAGIGKTVTVEDIAVSGADAGNYTWHTTGTATADIGRAVLTINTVGVDKTYDGTTDASTTFTDNRFAGDDLTVIAGEANFIDKNAETNKQISISGISATGADASNYIWDATAVATAAINKAALNVAALASDKVYDGKTAATTLLTDNRVLGDDLLATSATSSFADKNAGSGKRVLVAGIAVSGTDANNYTWNTDARATASITKANLVVDATGADKTYDSTTSASVALADNRVLGDSLALSYGTATFADKNAGTGKAISVGGITVTGADAGNYTWNVSDVASASIEKASLTITADGVDKTYDGTKTGSVVLSDSRYANDELVVSAGSVMFDDKNAGAGKAMSVSGINVSGADAQNYVWNTSTAASADIAKAALTVGATAQDKVYDTSTSASLGFTDNRIPGDLLSISGSGSFSDKNAGSGKTVSVAGISVTGADAGNYSWNTSAVALADISKANLVVSAVASDKTYDGTTGTSATLSDNRLGSDSLVLASSGVNFSDKNAGSGKSVTISGITVTGSDAGNYAWNATAASTATIDKAVLTVSGTASGKTYDGSVNATTSLTDNRVGSDDLTITSARSEFEDKNAGLNKLVSIDGIAVAGADASNYTWNTTATSTADIAKATLSVTATAQNKVYDTTTAATTSLSDNRVAGDDLVIDSTGSAFADKNAGTGKIVTVSGITLSGADAMNYVTENSTTTTATIGKASLSVTADAADKIYNGATSTTATLSDNRLSGDNLVLSYGSADFTDKNAGASKSVSVSDVSVTGADAMNYTWNTTATDTASITKANLAITASGENKVYDGTADATVALADNRVIGDQLTLVASDTHFSDKNAGASKAITVSGVTVTGTDAGNYVWSTSTTAQADIKKRLLQVNGVGVNKTYDGTTDTTANLVDDRIVGDSLVITSAGAAFADKNAGTGKTVLIDGISVTGADASNYTWSSAAAATADIAKAQLTVTANAADKVYNGTTEALSTYSDDRLAGDTLAVNVASSTFSDKNAGTGKTVTINGITLSGADAQNYTVNSVAVATANITKAELTVGAAGVTKVYDGSTDAQVSLSDNRVAGDDLVVASAIAKYADKNAGANKAIGVNGITVSGADSSNYTWNESASAQGNIEKANLIISGVVQDKVYDGSNSATLESLSDNRIAGDNLNLTASGAAFGDKNAGANKAATINGVSVTGTDAGNYNWNSVSTSAAEITKAFLQLAAVGQDKVYDGTANAKVSVSDNRIAGDQVVVTVGSAQFEDKNAGTDKSITATGLSLSGADAGNYSITDTLTARANVSRADIAISANQVKKVKGDQDPALGWKLNGGALFSGDAVRGSLERAVGEELGTYAVGQGTLSAGDNYNLTFTAGELTITDAPKQSPNDLESVVSAVKKGVPGIPNVRQGQLMEKNLGYNMLNLGIKLPETLLDGVAMNPDDVDILK